MTPMVVFCCDPLRPRFVDDYFVAQAAAVRSSGVVVTLLDHDALLAGDVDRAARRIPDNSLLWYRGWMISSSRYRELAEVLHQRGCELVVSPELYAAAHELPGWYGAFSELTPASVWTPSAPGTVPSESELATLVQPLGDGPGIIKDFVKSRKHEWDTACFVEDLGDTAGLRRIVERFVELQEDDLAGGLVVRAFEDFGGHGHGRGNGHRGERDVAARPAEARVWWMDGEPVLISPHPDNPDVCPEPDLTRVGPAVARLRCRFITTDLVRRADGVWRVVEVGDGQVSDLASSVDPAALMKSLRF